MKSIFKKIAFVLALAMVVTLFPVMNASAAVKDNKYARTKNATLFVGGDANGNYESCWATGKKAKALVKEDGYKSIYTTNDEEGKIVSVSKYGEVTAVGVGKATVTATFTKKGEKDIVESFEVTVKKNAVKVAFEEELQKKLTEGLTVGDKITFKAVQTGENGATDVTDAAKFTVTDAEGTVQKFNENEEYEAVKAGKITVTVRSWQWSWDSTLKKNVSTPTTEEVSIEVEVKEAGLVSATQITLSKFEVTTGTAEVAKAIKDAFTDSSKYSQRLVVDRRISEQLIIKDLAIANMEISDIEPNVITVTMVDPIEANSTYVILYNEDKKEFVGVEDKPASIEIKTTEAQVQVEQLIEVVIRTKEGIDITDNHKASWWIEAPASDEYYATSNSILFWEEGKKATVTAVYDMGWDLEKNVKIPDLKATRTISSVKELASTNLVRGFAVSGKSNEDEKKLAYTSGVIRLAVGDERYLYAKYSTTQSGSEKDQFLTPANQHEFNIISSNNHVVSVSNGVLYPQNAGSASITVKRNNQLIGVAYISVESGRNLDPATIDVQFNKRKLAGGNNDQVIVTVKAKDQLGEDIKPGIKDINVSNKKVTGVTDKNKITFIAGTKVNETVTVSMNIFYGTVTRPYRFAISVKDVTDVSTANYGVSVSKDELNAKLDKTDKHTANIVITELDSEGFYLKDFSGDVTPISGLNEITKDQDGNYTPGMYVQVSKGNDSFKDFMLGGAFDVLGKQTGVTVAAITASGSAINVKGIAPNGTYLARVYYVDNAGRAPLLKGSTTFTVKDDTNLAAVVKKYTVKVDEKNNITLASLAEAINLKIDNVEQTWNGTTVIKDGITYRLENYKLSNSSAKDSYFVTSIVVSVIKDDLCVQYALPVNRLFTK